MLRFSIKCLVLKANLMEIRFSIKCKNVTKDYRISLNKQPVCLFKNQTASKALIQVRCLFKKKLKTERKLSLNKERRHCFFGTDTRFSFYIYQFVLIIIHIDRIIFLCRFLQHLIHLMDLR